MSALSPNACPEFLVQPRQQVPAPGSGTAASSNEGMDTATANKLKVAFILFAIVSRAKALQ